MEKLNNRRQKYMLLYNLTLKQTAPSLFSNSYLRGRFSQSTWLHFLRKKWLASFVKTIT